MKVAKKWADLTKTNIGKMVAFKIDDSIYTLPKIMAEIKTDEALINGLGNEMNAKNISQALNSSIPN
jgi:preprotein translocase subunit SecD